MKNKVNTLIKLSLLAGLINTVTLNQASAAEKNPSYQYKETFMISSNNESISVALITFDNISKIKELDYMEKGIPRIFNTNFSKSRSFTVIDRNTVEQALETINHSKITPAIAKKIGNITGADYVVFGNIQKVGEDIPEILISTNIVATKTGEVKYSESIKTNDENMIINILDKLSVIIANDINSEIGLAPQIVKEPEEKNIKPSPISNSDSNLSLYDSDKIVFTAKDSKNIRHIFIGQGNNQVTKISEGNENNDSPVWSPDGSKVAYVNQKYGVTVFDLNTSKNYRLADQPVFDDIPHWTNDGNKILFTTKENKNYAIYSANNDGSGLKALSPDEIDVKSFDVSKYNMIIYSAKIDKLWQIFLMDINGNNVSQLTYEGNNISPSWSPDGTKITFISDRDKYSKVYVMNSNSKNQVKITTGDDHEESPIWSPDGSKIAFISINKKRGKVSTINPDGTEQKLLTNDNSDNYDLIWLPDGKSLGFTSDGNIYTINLEDNLKTMINLPLHDIEQPVWKQ